MLTSRNLRFPLKDKYVIINHLDLIIIRYIRTNKINYGKSKG